MKAVACLLCAFFVGAAISTDPQNNAPHYGIDPGTTAPYSPPNELLESTEGVEGTTAAQYTCHAVITRYFVPLLIPYVPLFRR